MAGTSGSASARLQAAWGERGLLAVALLPIAWLFGLLGALRRLLYRVGVLRVHRLGVPVIVVGNIVAGGAGKTPTVIALAEQLRRHGRTPGIVSRGYGRRAEVLLDVGADADASACGDEPLLMRLRTGLPVVVSADRVAAGRALLHDHPEVDVVISDDGLQHLRLARNAQVLVFDERGAGNGWLLPAGPLREPLPSHVPARSLVLYNASAPSTPLRGHMVARGLRGAVGLAQWWRGERATPAALQALRGRRLVAAAGMARPQRFFEMLAHAGLKVEPLPLPDHHDYTALPWPLDTPDVIVTEKDAVKLRPGRAGATRIWVATLDFALDDGFVADLLKLLAPRA